MGMYYSAYFAYGAPIPDVDPQQLEETELPNGIRHLMAGSYDHQRTFLTAQFTEIDLGDFKTVTPQTATPEQYTLWNTRIREAANALGVNPTHEPAWLVIPDMY